MSYWNGTAWLDERPAPQSKPRTADRAATGVMLVAAIALLIPVLGASAAGKKARPVLAVDCGSHCVVGGSMTVFGSGFVPSSGGQQVILYVEYPGETSGEYLYPVVDDAGRFATTVDNALTEAGTGGVAAFQYSARTDKWSNVAYADFTAR